MNVPIPFDNAASSLSTAKDTINTDRFFAENFVLRAVKTFQHTLNLAKIFLEFGKGLAEHVDNF